MFNWSVGWYGSDRNTHSQTKFGKVDFGKTDVKVNAIAKASRIPCTHQSSQIMKSRSYSPLKLLWWASFVMGIRAQQNKQFPAQFELSTLDGANGFVITGSDIRMSSVSNAGDVNGDGFDDILIGAAYNTPVGNTLAGKVYVVFGKQGLGSSGSFDLSILDGDSGFVINGELKDDRCGSAVSSAGDVNGDGIADIMIGAYKADPGGRSEAGKSYVVFGKKKLGSSGVIELSKLNGTSGLILSGEQGNDWSGDSVSSAGDVNHDGITDLLVGAYYAGLPNRSKAGKSYLVYGKKNFGSSGHIELSSLNGTNGIIFNGESNRDHSGISIAYVGDVNQDGVDDFLIGARGSSLTSGITRTYVIFGKESFVSNGTFEISSLNGNSGFIVNGESVGDRSGRSVSSAGDVNGDLIPDILIGAYWADIAGKSQAGKTYVVFGKNSLGSSGSVELSGLTGSTGLVLNGEQAYSESGNSVSNAGDINGDGVDDLVIGAHLADISGRNRVGKAYVVYGQQGLRSSGSLELSSLDGTNGFIINGEQEDDRCGSTVSNAGDVNGDGRDDLIVLAPSAGTYGITYVIFGIGTPKTTTTSTTIRLTTSLISQTQPNTQRDSTRTLDPTDLLSLQSQNILPTDGAAMSSPTSMLTEENIPGTNGFVSSLMRHDTKTGQSTIHPLTSMLDIQDSQSLSPSSSVSTHLIVGIAAAVAALVSGLLTGGFCYLKRRSERRSHNGGTPLDKVDSKHEYDSITILPGMRASQSDGNYDLIPAGKQQSHYTDLPSHQLPHDSKHYTSIDKVEKAHDVYVEAKMKKAKDYYDDV